MGPMAARASLKVMKKRLFTIWDTDSPVRSDLPASRCSMPFSHRPYWTMKGRSRPISCRIPARASGLGEMPLASK